MEIQKVSWTVPGRRLTAAAGSVVGSRYRDNYDVLHLDGGRILAVIADGMGDGPGSAIAGRTAVDVFVRETKPSETKPGETTPSETKPGEPKPGEPKPGQPKPGETGPAALRAAVAKVQQEVRRAGRDLRELTGCTLTAFAGDPDRTGDATPAAWIVQLGDSRAYRLRNGLLELLTVDHTVAWLGVLHGWFAVDSPEAQAARYRLTRYAGHRDEPEPDVLNVTLHPGDIYLLCTDGVADQLSYERLAQLLGAAGDPGAAVQALLDETLTAGGTDNATAVVIRVEWTVADS